MPDSGRRMQKLFPAAVPVSEKREVLSFLCQGFRMRTNRRLVAIHGSMRAFLGTSMSPHPGGSQKAKNF